MEPIVRQITENPMYAAVALLLFALLAVLVVKKLLKLALIALVALGGYAFYLHQQGRTPPDPRKLATELQKKASEVGEKVREQMTKTVRDAAQGEIRQQLELKLREHLQQVPSEAGALPGEAPNPGEPK